VAIEVAQSDKTLWTYPAEEISRLHKEILSHARASLQNAIRIGEVLSQVKEALKHGEWLPWLEEYAPFAERTARNYVKVFDNRVALKSASVADLGAAYSFLLSNGNEASDAGTPRLHEPNFHSQAVRLRQNLVGVFNHYLQRRPLKVWQTEEVYDLLCSLKPLIEMCTQLELELGTRSDVPSSYRATHGS
jgi:hypothetical protein